MSIITKIWLSSATLEVVAPPRLSYLQVIRAQDYSVMFPESAQYHGLALIADNMLECDTILPQIGSSSQFEKCVSFVSSGSDVVDDVWYRGIVALNLWYE